MPGNLTVVDTEIATIATQLTNLATAQADIAQMLRNGLPDVAMTPFQDVNATALATDAAPQVIKAAVGGKRHFITGCVAVNITSGEDAVTFIQDEDDVISAVVVPADAGAVTKDADAGRYTFNPPLIIASGKAIEIHVASATDIGDVYVAVNGFVED